MLTRLSRWGSREDGMIAPVSLAILIAAGLLVAATATAAIRANDGSIRDRSTKQAFDAAEAGLQVAAWRLNKTQPTDDHCVTAVVKADGSLGPMSATGSPIAVDSDPDRDWCAVQPTLDGTSQPGYERLEDGSRFNYQVSTAYRQDSKVLRTIVSTGVSGCDGGARCVKQRVAGEFDAQAGRGDYALWGAKGVEINNGTDVTELSSPSPSSVNCPYPGPIAVDEASFYKKDGFCGAKIGTGGELIIGGTTPRVCGRARMLPGQLYKNTGNTPSNLPPGRCLPANAAVGIPGAGSTSEPGVPPDPVANYFLGSADDTQLIVDRTTPLRPPLPVTLPPSTTPLPPTTKQDGIGDSWYNPGGSSASDGKRLVVDNQTGTSLTLTGNSYAVCYLRVGRGAIFIQPENPTEPVMFYVVKPGGQLPNGDTCPGNDGGTPPDTIAGAKWGQVHFRGSGKLINTTADPGKFMLQVEGDASADDGVEFGGNFSWQAVPVYAPNSHIDIGNDTGLSMAQGETVTVSGNKGIHWDDRVSDIIPGAKHVVYYRTWWGECSAEPQTPLAPASGC